MKLSQIHVKKPKKVTKLRKLKWQADDKRRTNRVH